MLVKQRRQSSRRIQGFDGWILTSNGYKWLVMYKKSLPFSVGTRCDVYFDRLSMVIALKRNKKANLIIKHSDNCVRIRCDDINAREHTNYKLAPNKGNFDLMLVPERF